MKSVNNYTRHWLIDVLTFLYILYWCPTQSEASLGVCPAGVHYQGKCYIFNDNPLTWDNAKRKCIQEGSILAEPIDSDTLNFLFTAGVNILEGSFAVWIGASYNGTAISFVTNTESPFNHMSLVTPPMIAGRDVMMRQTQDGSERDLKLAAKTKVKRSVCQVDAVLHPQVYILPLYIPEGQSVTLEIMSMVSDLDFEVKEKIYFDGKSVLRADVQVNYLDVVELDLTMGGFIIPDQLYVMEIQTSSQLTVVLNMHRLASNIGCYSTLIVPVLDIQLTPTDQWTWIFSAPFTSIYHIYGINVQSSKTNVHISKTSSKGALETGDISETGIGQKEVKYLDSLHVTSQVIDKEFVFVTADHFINVFVYSQAQKKWSGRVPTMYQVFPTSWAVPENVVFPRPTTQFNSHLDIVTTSLDGVDHFKINIDDNAYVPTETTIAVALQDVAQGPNEFTVVTESTGVPFQVTQEFQSLFDGTAKMDILPRQSWLTEYAFSFNHFWSRGFTSVIVYLVYHHTDHKLLVPKLAGIELSCSQITGSNLEGCHAIIEGALTIDVVFRLSLEDGRPFSASLCAWATNSVELICRPLGFNDDPDMWTTLPSEVTTTNDQPEVASTEALDAPTSASEKPSDTTARDETTLTKDDNNSHWASWDAATISTNGGVVPRSTEPMDTTTSDDVKVVTSHDLTATGGVTLTDSLDLHTTESTWNSWDTSTDDAFWERGYSTDDPFLERGYNTTRVSCYDVTTLEMCSCKCKCANKVKPSNLCRPPVIVPPIRNEEEKEEMVTAIKKELEVDVQKTSAFIRKKISAPDERASSSSIGYLGIAMISLVLSLVLFPDVVTLFTFLAAGLLRR